MSAQGDAARGTSGLVDGSLPAVGPAKPQAAVDLGATRPARGYPGRLRPGSADPAEQAIAHVDAPGQAVGAGSGQSSGRSLLGRRRRAGAKAGAGRAAAATDAARRSPAWKAPAGKGGLGGRGRAGAQASVWQQAWDFWDEAGLAWGGSDPVGGPGEAVGGPGKPEHDHTEPIPAIRDAAPPAAVERPGDGKAQAPDRQVQRPADQGPAGPGTDGNQAERPQAERAGAGEQPRRSPPGRRRAVVGAAVAVLVAAGGVYAWQAAGTGAASLGSVAGMPVAHLADGDFAPRPGAAGPGAAPVLAGLAGSGSDLVAFGSKPGVPAAAPFFLFSSDGGRDWSAAGPARGTAAVPAGATPVMAAGGPGRWLALGPAAAWVSANGLSWTAVAGIAPLEAGDQVLALSWTGSEFVAVGQHASASGVARAPVAWTSADGLSWRRLAGRALRLPANGQVGALRWAVSRGRVLIVGGDVARTTARRRGGRKAAAVSYLQGAWRTTDGGARWTPVTVPTSHGASPWLGGVAAGGRFLLAVRPGRTTGGRPDAVTFVSSTGRRWRFAGKLTGGALRLGGVVGDGDGVVVTGSVGARQVGFVTVDGRRWTRVSLGEAAAALSGVTVGPGGAVVADGSAPVSGPDGASSGSSPFLLLAGARTANVGRRPLAVAARSLVAVRALADGGGREVAVGSADGAAAVWVRSAAGRWSRADAGAALAGASRLTSVAHGRAGWLAIGGDPAPIGLAASVGTPRPVAASAVLTSGNGSSWLVAPGAGPLTAPGVGLAGAAAGGAGYVVVGEQVSNGQVVAAAWWSSSLTSWAPAVGWPGGTAGQPSQALAVAAGGSGFAAAGAVGATPAVWVSRDGRDWTVSVLPLPQGRQQAELTHVAMERRRIVAVGMATSDSGTGQAPFAAVSLDGGRTWRESMLPASGSRAAVTALAATRTGFVAAGTRGVPGRQRTVFWWTASGRGWGMAPAGPGGVTALRLAGSTLTGVGFQDGAGGEHPVLWLAPAR